ncbi:MAG: hypothetical protein Kow0065_10680 [Methylomicrobium sp.]
MAGIQAPGVGSNLDINSIVTQLIEAERKPAETRFASQEALVQARLSTLGIVKSSVSDFQSALRGLSSLTAFQSKTASVGNERLFSTTVSSAAVAGSYSVEVKRLAQGQKLATESLADTTSIIGGGKLTISFGTYDGDSNVFTENDEKPARTVDIAASSSLSDIRDAINGAGIGVTASILNDGNGFRLVLGSESGVANGMKIDVTDTGGNPLLDSSGLGLLAFDPTAAVGSGKNMEQKLEAKNALLVVDGIEVTRSTNSVSGVIAGVTLDLKEMAEGAPTTLSIQANKDSIKEAVEKFVTGYNELRGVLNKASVYDAEEKKPSLLTGDSAIRSINNQMQRIMGTVVTGLTGPLRALADIGITTARDGTLSLDSARLNRALDTNIDEFSALFATMGRASDSNISFFSSSSQTKVGSYAVNITQLASQGVYTGNDIGSEPFDIVAGSSFKITVDGVQSGTITLNEKIGLTGSELASELQSQINKDSALLSANRSVQVGFEGGKISIKSARYGSDSTIAISNINAGSSSLGLINAAGVAGQDVAGTIGGVAATGKGTRLTGAGDAQDLQIDIAGGVLGDRGTVSFTKGFAQELNTLVGSFLASDGVLTQRTNDFNREIEDIADKKTRLNERLENLETRLRAQFLAMDLMVGQMRATSDFLGAQLQSLPNANSK